MTTVFSAYRTTFLTWQSVCLGLALGPLMPDESAAQEPERPRTIEELVEAQPRWQSLVDVTLRLNGRYTIFSASELRFVNCDVRFLMDREFRRPTGRSKVIEVAGTLTKQKDEFVFLVSELRQRPSDLDELRNQTMRMDQTLAESWYGLATWARERGEFYDDETLEQAVLELYETGLAVARRRIRDDDVAGLRALAHEANQMRLPGSMVQPLIHDALRAEWTHLRSQPQRDITPLLDQIRQELPGSEVPLQVPFEALQQEYEVSPRSVYLNADQTTRGQLHRLLYAEVMRNEIERDADANGSNGYAIAARIDRHLPELGMVSAEFRAREMEYLSQHAEDLSRGQLLDLATRLESQGQQQQALEFKRAWVRHRHARVRGDGPRGLMELGDEALMLLEDTAEAARYFIEASELNPQLATPREWLVDHGYQQRDGEWSSVKDLQDAPVDPVERAIREGQVKIGMSQQQVRAALGGEPSSTFRTASAGKLTEFWVYEEHRVAVQFSRLLRQSESRVVRVAGTR